LKGTGFSPYIRQAEREVEDEFQNLLEWREHRDGWSVYDSVHHIFVRRIVEELRTLPPAEKAVNLKIV
jgi:hypothetical protein